jgi:hypothetical protein
MDTPLLPIVETTYGVAPRLRVRVARFHSAWRWAVSNDHQVLLEDLAETEPEAWTRAEAALGRLQPKEIA